MKTKLLAAALVVATAGVTTAIVLPSATAQSPASPASVPAEVPGSAPVVVGLPDFTRLVEQVGPGVVNIEATVGARTAQRSPRGGQQQMPDEMPEIFRRIFGPMPGMPGGQEEAPERRGVSVGTGFIISADGYILTNHHVVAGADEVKVRMSDRREFTARVVGSDEQSDVALLKVDGRGLPALRTGESGKLKPGQWAIAIGSPFGLDQSVTAGIVSAVGRSNPYANQQYVPFIQTDVAINRGNSGGPLLNTRGEVIGINSQIFSNSGGYMGVSFAIPIDLALNVVEQLKSTGEVRRGQVGIQLQSINAEQARGLGLPDTLGALVNGVVPGGPGEKAGIEAGDVIRTVNGQPVRQSSDLPPMIGAMAPGSKVTLGVFREGRTRDVVVTLTQLDPSLLSGGGGERGGAAPAPAQPAANALGIIGQDLTAAQRSQLGLPAGEGVRIARVEGMAAREAGLTAGDVVLRVGRTPVASAAALDRAVRETKPGDTVMLLIRGRTGGTQFIAVTPRAEASDR